ncbi:MAG: aspartate/glutamate racemase family protein [Cytophagales bacterium]|nr:aspartate/glutamate racemase family protein [Cytophagales bacterium]
MTARKKLGIVGGMGARASALLLQKVVDYSPVVSDQEFIEILLHNNSRIPDRTRAILKGGPSPEKELLRSIAIFNEQRVDAIVLACVTSYYYYDRLAAHTDAYLINPVTLVRDHLVRHAPGLTRIGLLASTGTIQSGLFREAFGRYGLEIITLEEQDQEEKFMASLYMPNGLKSGTVSAAARDRFFEAVEALRRKRVEVIVGGCSEVAILLSQASLDVPYADAMDLAAREAVGYCYGQTPAPAVPVANP